MACWVRLTRAEAKAAQAAASGGAKSGGGGGTVLLGSTRMRLVAASAVDYENATFDKLRAVASSGGRTVLVRVKDVRSF